MFQVGQNTRRLVIHISLCLTSMSEVIVCCIEKVLVSVTPYKENIKWAFMVCKNHLTIFQGALILLCCPMVLFTFNHWQCWTFSTAEFSKANGTSVHSVQNGNNHLKKGQIEMWLLCLPFFSLWILILYSPLEEQHKRLSSQILGCPRLSSLSPIFNSVTVLRCRRYTQIGWELK